MKYFLAGTVGFVAFLVVLSTLDAATISFVISSPSSYQVFQRGTNGLGDIKIRGTYIGTSTARVVEASWNGSPFATIATLSPSSTFSGTLPQMPGGQGTLVIRLKGARTERTSVPLVGVGDVYVVAGQSNASGRAGTQVYSHPTLKAGLFGNDDVWKDLKDPTDSAVGQIDYVSADVYPSTGVNGARGSAWPLVATYLMAHENVPVAFVPAARGGTSILQWERGTATTTLYGSMMRRINAVGPIKAVLWFQGEEDAKHAMPREVYSENLRALASNIQNDFGAPLIAGQLANGPYLVASQDAIKLAIVDAWNEGTVKVGPTYLDVDLADDELRADGLHFISNGDIKVFAQRWWGVLKHHFYNAPDGRGPRLVEATWGNTRSEIIVTFTDETLPVIPPQNSGAFVVKSGGSIISIASIFLTGDNKIKLKLSAPVNGDATLSLGAEKKGIQGMPTDSSEFRFPAEIFVDQPVQGSLPEVGVTYSGVPSNWVPVQASISYDDAAGIYTLTENAALEQHRASYLLKIPTGLTSAAYWSFSAVVKLVDPQRSQVQLSIVNASLSSEAITVRCDLTGAGVTKVLTGTTGTVTDTSIEALSDGWYRCTITGRPGTTAGARLRVIATILNSQGAPRYQGNGTSSMLLRDFSLRGAATLEELPSN